MSVILIIEDDEQVRVLAESVLRDAGYEVLAATAAASRAARICFRLSSGLGCRSSPFSSIRPIGQGSAGQGEDEIRHSFLEDMRRN